MTRQQISNHGPTHRPDGQDPDGGIYFDVVNVGNWLDIEVDGTTGPSGFGVYFTGPLSSGGLIAFQDSGDPLNFVSFLGSGGGKTMLDIGMNSATGNALFANGGGFSWDTGAYNNYGFYADVRQGGGIGFTDFGNGGMFFTDHDGGGGFNVRLGQFGTGSATGGGFNVTDWTNSGILLATNTGNSGGGGGITLTDQGTGGIGASTNGTMALSSTGNASLISGAAVLMLGVSPVIVLATGGVTSGVIQMRIGTAGNYFSISDNAPVEQFRVTPQGTTVMHVFDGSHNSIFEIRSDGSLHGKTGKSLVFDL